MFMILCVIDQTEQLEPILTAWSKNGITGVTIVESSGLHRLMEQPVVPMRFAFGSPGAERGNITLLTVVENEAAIQRCLELTEAITSDFSKPNTGIFVAWPVGFAKGVAGKQPH